jgi:hypothetical protein
MVTKPSIIRIRRGTEQEWNNANPVLMDGEMGLVTTGAETGKIKVGDGKTPWKQLSFTIGGKGDKGDTPALTVDKTNTTEAGTQAKVTLNGNKFTFDIPKGKDGSSLYITITHDKLLWTRAQQSLETGVFYLITDYKTIYKQPGTGIISTDTPDLDTPIEPLLVLATSKNTLDVKAYSPEYPQDEIWYDVERNNKTRYGWATENDRGQIYRRITKNKNDFPYDVRAVKFNRNAVNYYTFDYNHLFDSIPIQDNIMGVFKYDGIQQLNNSVFFGKNFSANNISGNFHDNNIGDNFCGNTVCEGFCYNTIGDWFQSNVFGARFQNQHMKSFEISSSNRLRHNEFGSGIMKQKVWKKEMQEILLSDITMKLSATGETSAVAFVYQDTAGTIKTGVIR